MPSIDNMQAHMALRALHEDTTGKSQGAHLVGRIGLIQRPRLLSVADFDDGSCAPRCECMRTQAMRMVCASARGSSYNSSLYARTEGLDVGGAKGPLRRPMCTQARAHVC
jgi:hypothetical protein